MVISWCAHAHVEQRQKNLARSLETNMVNTYDIEYAVQGWLTRKSSSTYACLEGCIIIAAASK